MAYKNSCCPVNIGAFGAVRKFLKNTEKTGNLRVNRRYSHKSVVKKNAGGLKKFAVIRSFFYFLLLGGKMNVMLQIKSILLTNICCLLFSVKTNMTNEKLYEELISGKNSLRSQAIIIFQACNDDRNLPRDLNGIQLIRERQGRELHRGFTELTRHVT